MMHAIYSIFNMNIISIVFWIHLVGSLICINQVRLSNIDIRAAENWLIDDIAHSIDPHTRKL